MAALTALGVLGTGVSFVLYYSLIGSQGPAKASLVAYVAPGFSVIYGVTILDESFSAGHRGRAGADRRRLLARGRGPARLEAGARRPGRGYCRLTASWPQAASMSRPRVRRTVARTPFDSKAALNAATAGRVEPWKPVSVGL